MNQSPHFESALTRQLIQQCKSRGSRLKVADSNGTKLSGKQLLLRSLLLRCMLFKHVLKPDEDNIGILLPPSVPAVVTNFAVAFSKRVAVNLNYTVSAAILNQCIELACIKHILTSRRVMEKLDLKLNAEIVYLEDLREQVTIPVKLMSLVQAKLLPNAMLESQLGIKTTKPDDPLTIIFTSGSTGIPKGVVLTYRNILSNVDAIQSVFHLTADDVVLGVLPFFHVFGYTVTLWAALASEPAGVYHFSPLEPRPIGKLAEQYGATVLLATPTFLRTYIRRIEPQQFSKLDIVVAGAEKLPMALSDAFEKQFGVRPIEGYGTTELSPLVSVNMPPSRTQVTDSTKGLREGSVGRCVPGVEARIVSLDDGSLLASGESGMLQVRGPNVMKGYLNRDDLTAQVIRDGWYETGDIALIDNEGFIHITGRQSRFSKIGGEMIPHIQIEETIARILGGDEGELQAVVTAVPDEKRGERLIVLHVPMSKTPGEVLSGLSAEGLPNLYLPSEDSFIQVDEIPVLGSGKLDLKGMQQLARKKLGLDTSQ